MISSHEVAVHLKGLIHAWKAMLRSIPTVPRVRPASQWCHLWTVAWMCVYGQVCPRMSVSVQWYCLTFSYGKVLQKICWIVPAQGSVDNPYKIEGKKEQRGSSSQGCGQKNWMWAVHTLILLMLLTLLTRLPDAIKHCFVLQ